MTTVHHLRVAVARCSSLLQRYHDGERSPVLRERMTAEVEVLVGWLIELNLPPGRMQTGLLQPVEVWLLERYGPEVGLRINGDFVEAFERAGMSLLAEADCGSIAELPEPS